MAKIYAKLILKGEKKIDEIPGNLKAQVLEILRSWENS